MKENRSIAGIHFVEMKCGHAQIVDSDGLESMRNAIVICHMNKEVLNYTINNRQISDIGVDPKCP
jgi:hypothetical protein